MKHRLKKITVLTIIIVLAGGVCAHAGRLRNGIYGRGDRVPQPTLLAPTTETIDLTGKVELEFKWSPHESARGFRLYYDFRLYKGYDMTEGNLMVKEKVSSDTYRVAFPADLFQNNGIYTWSLKQVYDGGRKSLRSYQSFTVIKNQTGR
jgi:hypothetical protein